MGDPDLRLRAARRGHRAFNPNATFNKLSIFFNFGTTGADAGERTYMFDDVTFIGGTTVVEPPSDVTVTFNVDMTCAEAPESFNAVYIQGLSVGGALMATPSLILTETA